MSQSDPHLLENFARDLALQEVAPKTVDSYRLDLTDFWRWFAESVSDSPTPDSVTPSDIRDYSSHLINIEQRKPATLNRRLAALRKFFLWAKAKGFVRELPTEQVKGVTSSPRAPRWIEKREVDRLIRTVERHGTGRDQAILLTLRHTGIRVSELCAIRVGDLETSERKGSLVVRSGKGGKYRDVPLNLDARRAIQSYLEVRPSTPSDYLFIGQRGQGLTTRAVELLVAKYSRLAGLEGVTPHTLRHSFCKHTLDAGADLVTVSALAGHQRLETAAIYTTPSARDLECRGSRIVQ